MQEAPNPIDPQSGPAKGSGQQGTSNQKKLEQRPQQENSPPSGF